MGRRRCPECDQRKFTLYVDAFTKKPYGDHVGVCYRSHSCGHDYTPIDLQRDGGKIPDHRTNDHLHEIPPVPVLPGYREQWHHLESSMKRHEANRFLAFLSTVFPADAVAKAAREYAIGTCTKAGLFYGAPVFWQVDGDGEVRCGKVRQYEGGHGTATNWHHVVVRGLYADAMQQMGRRLDQCLFGLHLARKYPTATIAVVEAEKTAIIGRILMPSLVWMATGGKDGFGLARMSAIKGRRTVVIPDVDAFATWTEKAASMEPMFPDGLLTVSDILQCIAGPGDETADLADFVLSGRINIGQEHSANPERLDAPLSEPMAPNR